MTVFDLADCTVSGPALPDGFVRHDFKAVLTRLGLPLTPPAAFWPPLRQRLLALGQEPGRLRVLNHVIAPLAASLGYTTPERADKVVTREGSEEGGWTLHAPSGLRLRAFAYAAGADLDAPARGGRAFRLSPSRAAQRVLYTTNETAGLLTDGQELRVLFNDRVRAGSHLSIALSGAAGWRNQPEPPDSWRLLHALVSPAGMQGLPAILDAARQTQARVTGDLRLQARAAIEGFIQAVLDHPDNRAALPAATPSFAQALWAEGLVMVYRLLFILCLEGSTDPSRTLSFASTELWQEAFSPSRVLAPLVRRRLDQGHQTGRMLEQGLRTVFRLFRTGLRCAGLTVSPLGGALFGIGATPWLDRLTWGEMAVAILLDRLLWAEPGLGPRRRVQYGALDIEELGRVYEALLELTPGIADRPMIRLRRARLEVVVPAEQTAAAEAPADAVQADPVTATRPRARQNSAGTPTVVAGRIEAGGFFLRAGLGRKSTGAFYTPHEFVRFLVRETLAPVVAARSPDAEPDPAAILALKIVDPATGSGHFLVEACRFLGDALYAACLRAEALASVAERAGCAERAANLRGRIEALPDPDATLAAWLPGHANAQAGSMAGAMARGRAVALCRRMVAVRCLYGVDRNTLAVELARLSLWLESYADGLPLTFLDHRIVVGDSLSGPFLSDLGHFPVSGKALDPLLAHGLTDRLLDVHRHALAEVAAMEATLGRDIADLALKSAAGERLEKRLDPLRRLARAWSGAAVQRGGADDDEWLALARGVADAGEWPRKPTQRQDALLAAGADAIAWDLAFPDVFRPAGGGGFDVVLGNPPWDTVQPRIQEYLSGLDLAVLTPDTRSARAAIERRLLADPAVMEGFRTWRAGFDARKAIAERLYRHQSAPTSRGQTAGNLDLYRLFVERSLALTAPDGAIGMVLPSAFHANEGATGIRTLLMQETRLETCLSFENRRRLFEIDGRMRFDLIVARRPGPTVSTRCAFGLESFEHLAEPQRRMELDQGFLLATGGECRTFLEVRGQDDLRVARRLFGAARQFGPWCEAAGIRFGRDLHMTGDAALFQPVGSATAKPGAQPGRRHAPAPTTADLHEGKTFHQFTDRWETAPRYRVALTDLAGRPATLAALGAYRLAYRDIARPTDERTMIAAIVPPNTVCGHTATVERAPAGRSAREMLLALAIMNAFTFDWCARRKAGAHLSQYLVAGLPMPSLDGAAREFLIEAALRLVSNHAGFAGLWAVFGDAPTSWPVVAEPEERQRLRARMDAVIAVGFGLDRPDYQHVLAGFSHRSQPDAPALCLAAFDALVLPQGR